MRKRLNAFCAAALALATVTSSMPAGADDRCGDTVALNEPGQPFGPPAGAPADAPPVIPVRLQGKRGVCYGHAAANLIDAWRYTHPPSTPKGQPFKLSSPIGIAIENALKKGKTGSISLGDEADAIDTVLAHGKTCDDQFVLANNQHLELADDKLVKTLEKAWDDYTTYLSSMARARKLYAAYHETTRASWTPEMIELEPYHKIDLESRKLPWAAGFDHMYVEHGFAHAGQTLQCELLERGVPSANIPATFVKNTDLLLGKLLDGARSKVDFLERYFNQACTEHGVSLAGVPHPVQLPERGKRFYSPEHPEEVIRDLNRRFDLADKQPIAVGFCSAVLHKPYPDAGDRKLYDAPYTNDWYVSWGSKDGKPNWRCVSGDPEHPGGDSSHVATLIGRRRNPTDPTKCQFLLRNSWGTDCAKYAAGGWTDCHNGDVWIDAEALARNTMDITYLQP